MTLFGGRPRQGEQEGPFELGYAFSLSNLILGVEYLGVPHEILVELRSLGLDFTTVADHTDSEIRSSAVYKQEPDLAMSGGPAAFAVMELMAALEASDYAEAAEVLAAHPLLRQGNGDCAFPLLKSLVDGDLDAIGFLAEERVGLGVDTGLGMSVLHWAALLSPPEVIELLLAAGADPEQRSWMLVTPAELARKNRRRDAERALSRDRGRAVEVDARETLRRMRQAATTAG